jgi:hypothetical protein
MNRIARVRLVLVVTIVLALLTVPLAGARPVERPQAADRTDGGWLGAALRWLENVAGVRSPAPGQRHRFTSQSAMKDGNSTTGGSCIDPAGWPRPWCAD